MAAASATDSLSSVDRQAAVQSKSVVSAMNLYALQRVAVLHSALEPSRAFARQFRRMHDVVQSNARPTGKVWAAAVSNNAPLLTRSVLERAMRAVRYDGDASVSYDDLLSQGSALPSFDGFVWFGPGVNSDAVPHVLELSVGEQLSSARALTLVFPLMISSDLLEAVTSLETPAFVNLWRILSALRNYLEDRGISFDDPLPLEADRGSDRSSGLPRRVLLNMPPNSSDILVSSLIRRVRQQTSSRWDDNFARLAEFFVRNGTVRVPSSFRNEDGFPLGNWVAKQRSGVSRLSPYRRARLDALGFVWDTAESRWDVGYEHLLAFEQINGHVHVQKRYVAPDGFRLGLWCLRQRSDGSRGVITAAHRALLEKVGFTAAGVSRSPKSARQSLPVTVLRPRSPRQAELAEYTLDEGFAQLATFFRSHGHVRVPHGYESLRGFRLGAFVEKLRRRGPVSEITDDQLHDLDVMGFQWFRTGQDWEEGLSQLRLYCQEHGNAQVPVAHRTRDGFLLGNWCATQRKAKREDKLRNDRQRLLDELGFPWSERL